MELPFHRHLKELRTRLINIFAFVFIVFLLLLPFADFVFSISFQPIKDNIPHDNPIIFTALTEGFMTHIKMSFWWSLIISVPFIIYQAWLFVEPGLYEKEKKLFKLFIPLIFLFFWIGCAFAWFFFIPFTVSFSSGIIWEGTEFLPRLQNCMSFTLKTVFFSGIFFELPLLIFLLLRTKLISFNLLKKHRKKIYIGIFLFIMIMVSGDFFLQVLFFIPIVLLFELFLFIYGK